MSRLRIAVVTYNRIEATKRCLASIRNKTDCDYKLTVVDNGSDEETVSYLISLYEGKLIDNLYLFEKNMGVACGYNFALAVSEEEYFVRLDNDIVIKDPLWAEVLIGFLSQYKEIGTIGFHVWQNCPEESVSGLSGQVAFIARSYTTGACCMSRRDVHERLGFWCEDYGLYGEEDKDFGFRLYEAGLIAGYVDKRGRYIEHEHVPHHMDAVEKLRNDKNRIKTIRMFLLNQMLYKKKIRELYMPRRYDCLVDGMYVSFRSNKDYACLMKNVYKIGVQHESELRSQMYSRYRLSY